MAAGGDERNVAWRGPGGAGPLVLIGGAEDRFRGREILSRFVQLAGAGQGHVVVIATASTLGESAGAMYRDLFAGLGAGRVSTLRPLTREEAEDEAHAETLAAATGVFLTGGVQMRLTTTIGGTRLGRSLQLAHDRGAVVAGTSAGASALASHMIAFGRSGDTPKHRMVHLTAGLGLLPDAVVDQHFEQRTRYGRLLTAVAQSPSLVGIGLDEDTAAIVYSDRTMEVLGRGAVTVVDGSRIATDAPEAKAHRPVLVSGAVVHALPAGYWFDLRARRLLGRTGPPAREREVSE